MIPKKLKSKTRITKKLQQAVTNLSVDVFGLEEKANQNIVTYLKDVSTKTGIPKEELLVRIFRTNLIRSCIYQNVKPLREVPTQELISVFTAMDNGISEALQQNVVKGISTFFDGVSNAHNIPLTHIHICIDTKADKVRIRAFNKATFLEKIELKTLIKHFK